MSVTCATCAFFGNRPAPAKMATQGFGCCDYLPERGVTAGMLVSISFERECDKHRPGNPARVAALQRWVQENLKR